MTNNTVFLIVICIVSFVAIAMLLYKADPKSRYLSSSILCMLLFSIISTISMAVNYLAAYTGNQDGIGLASRLAKLIIGEGRWSLELFLSYFEGFTALSMALLFIYFLTLLYENKKRCKA